MGRRRPHEIKIRLSDKELDRLNRMVAKTNLTREDFLRMMIEGYTVQEVPKDYMMFQLDLSRACSMLRYNDLNRSLEPYEKAQLLQAADILTSVGTMMYSIYKPYYKDRNEK